jgi:hypothetical protein
MENVFTVLTIFTVISSLADAIMSRVHTKEAAIGLVRSTLGDLQSKGFLPNLDASIPDSLIANLLEAHPLIKLDAVIPVPNPTDPALTARVEAAEKANVAEEGRLDKIESTQTSIVDSLSKLSDAVAKLQPPTFTR